MGYRTYQSISDNVQTAPNQDRWLLTYSSLITLLFVLFLVLYASSDVQRQGFNQYLSELPTPIDSPAEFNSREELESFMDDLKSYEEAALDKADKDVGRPKYPSAVSEATKGALNSGHIREKKERIEIEFRSGVLFKAGSAELTSAARQMLARLALKLNQIPHVLRVEGYTDASPIRTVQFPSNWELSAARATSVVRELITNNIDPKRLVAVGYGSHQIIKSSRLQDESFNRRVLIVIEASTTQDISESLESQLKNFK